MVLFKGAFKAYLDGDPANTALGYFIDYLPGLHALRGMIGHESGHLVPDLVFDRDGKLLDSPVREFNAERFLQTIYPNEFPGVP